MLRFLRRFAAIRKKRRESKPKTPYTKFVISWLLTIAVIWVTWSYALATAALYLYGNTDPMTSLSERVCETIIAAILGYLVKSGIENISQYGYRGKVLDEAQSKMDEEAAG